jgi:SsrA-binding protein
MAPTPPSERVLVSNRRATYDWFLEDHFEAGVALVGSEVKSLRAGKANLQEAWIKVHSGTAWLVSCHISPYEQANRFNHDPLRERQLLLHKHELMKLTKAVREKGLTVIPVRIYLKGSRIKVEIATAKGKKNYDKRDSIRERDAQRELRRR